MFLIPKFGVNGVVYSNIVVSFVRVILCLIAVFRENISHATAFGTRELNRLFSDTYYKECPKSMIKGNWNLYMIVIVFLSISLLLLPLTIQKRNPSHGLTRK